MYLLNMVEKKERKKRVVKQKQKQKQTQKSNINININSNNKTPKRITRGTTTQSRFSPITVAPNIMIQPNPPSQFNPNEIYTRNNMQRDFNAIPNHNITNSPLYNPPIYNTYNYQNEIQDPMNRQTRQSSAYNDINEARTASRNGGSTMDVDIPNLIIPSLTNLRAPNFRAQSLMFNDESMGIGSIVSNHDLGESYTKNIENPTYIPTVSEASINQNVLSNIPTGVSPTQASGSQASVNQIFSTVANPTASGSQTSVNQIFSTVANPTASGSQASVNQIVSSYIPTVVNPTQASGSVASVNQPNLKQHLRNSINTIKSLIPLSEGERRLELYNEKRNFEQQLKDLKATK
jgi:hypothetical protein